MNAEPHAPQRVAIFDSGVGGLSIHAALVKHRPDLEYVFISDTAAHPYGNKPDQELIPRVLRVAKSIVTQLSPDLLVVACNTASTVALEELRAQLSIPIVGVVPAIKPAAAQTRSGTIAIVATPATIRRDYTQDLINQFAANLNVIKIGSVKLVAEAERKMAGEAVDNALIEHEIKPLLEHGECDVIVLACTHFPLLINSIEEVIKVNNEAWDGLILDSGDAIARRVSSLLEPISSTLKPAANGSWFTEAIDRQTALASELTRRDISYSGVIEV